MKIISILLFQNEFHNGLGSVFSTGDFSANGENLARFYEKFGRIFDELTSNGSGITNKI